MADNVLIPASGVGDSGKTVATDDIGGAQWQRVKIGIGADGSATDWSSSAPAPVIPGGFVTVTTDITRPADTNAYAVDDAFSNSTTAPTTGGFTLTGCARASGGSGIITDMVVMTSADQSTKMQGEIWLFNQSVTAINDNAAFAVTDSEIKTVIGKIPFIMEDSGNNGFAQAQNLSLGFTCIGSADLRYLVRIKNAYTPISGEVLTVVAKILQVT